MKYDFQIAQKLKDEYERRRELCSTMYNYYVGVTDTLREYPTTDRSNRKIVDNFIKSFIEEEVSFMVGQPITYVSRSNNSESVKEIEDALSGISATLDTELATNLLIFGESYELYYVNDEEFKIKEFSPLTSIAYCDTEGKVQLFIYFYKKELDDNIYMEIIDDNYIYHFQDGFIEISPPTPHYFGCVPVGVARLNNREKDTLFNNIKLLQDCYEALMSDWSNEIADTRLAYLVLTGVNIEENEATKMKKMGIMQLPEANCKAEWLVKSIPSDFIRQYRDIVKEDIYRVAQHIDNQTQIQSNTSGTMLLTRMNCLRLKIIAQNQAIKNCVKARIKCLFTFLNLTSSKGYDYKNIKIEPQLNLPSNDVETAQIMSQLNGKLSIKTGLSRLSFVTNAEEEWQRMLQEQREVMNLSDNLDNLEEGGESE